MRLVQSACRIRFCQSALSREQGLPAHDDQLQQFRSREPYVLAASRRQRTRAPDGGSGRPVACAPVGVDRQGRRDHAHANRPVPPLWAGRAEGRFDSITPRAGHQDSGPVHLLE